MRKILISGVSAAIVGLGLLASAGSAYAAGCLQPNQTNYSISDDSDDADRGYDANVAGFKCAPGEAVNQSQFNSYAAAPVAPRPNTAAAQFSQFDTESLSQD